MLKPIAFCVLTSLASCAFASDTMYFFNQKSRLGCGTITSVRNVNQTPLYDYEYEHLRGGRAASTDVAQLASGFGIVGQAVALATSMTVDLVRDSSATLEGVKEPENGVWKNIKAVRVLMDDGRVMNLPLTAQPKLVMGPKYEEGQRVTAYMIKDRKSIQITMKRKSPLPGEKLYDAYCSLTADVEEAAEAIKAKEFLVKEINIVYAQNQTSSETRIDANVGDAPKEKFPKP